MPLQDAAAARFDLTAWSSERRMMPLLDLMTAGMHMSVCFKAYELQSIPLKEVPPHGHQISLLRVPHRLLHNCFYNIFCGRKADRVNIRDCNLSFRTNPCV